MKYDINSAEYWALPDEERKRVRAESLIEKNIPDKYRSLTLADFPEKKKCADMIIAGSSGLIIGENGVGKTAFISVMYMEFIRTGKQPAVIINAPVLMEQINKDVAAGNMLHSIIEMEWGKFLPHLFIDEMDKIRYTEASFQNLFELINYRYSWNLQTVCVANGDGNAVREKIPQAVISRLTGNKEGNFNVMFGGVDRRR